MINSISNLFSQLCSWCTSACRKDPFARDLTFIRTTILENHPGVYDQLNPHFLSPLVKSYRVAQQTLKSANTVEEKAMALKEFGKSFGDTHLWIKYDFAKPTVKSSPRAVGIHTLKKDIVWVDIPTFDPSNTQQNDLEEVIRTLPQFREKTVIFDLRGNGGGNSAWGDGLLNAMFGEKYVSSRLTQQNSQVYTEWRVSTGNLGHMQQLLPILKNKFPENHPTIQWANNTIEGMKHATARGNRYYSEPQSNAEVPLISNAPSVFKGKILAIVDRGCGSACLDFIDGLKAVYPNVILAGETTSADSVYMELRTVRLPSGLGSFGFPIKVYRNRLRGHNIPYVPDIQIEGDLKNTAALQNWCKNFLHDK